MKEVEKLLEELKIKHSYSKKEIGINLNTVDFDRKSCLKT